MLKSARPEVIAQRRAGGDIRERRQMIREADVHSLGVKVAGLEVRGVPTPRHEVYQPLGARLVYP